jgi:hypothetical protein
MSQQGGTPSGHEDDWWGQLYDNSTEDTGPTAAPDSLDDRFASAAGAVGDGTSPAGAVGDAARPAGAAVPAPRGGAAAAGPVASARAPWEPPPTAPPGPATFPPAPPKPPGRPSPQAAPGSRVAPDGPSRASTGEGAPPTAESTTDAPVPRWDALPWEDTGTGPTRDDTGSTPIWDDTAAASGTPSADDEPPSSNPRDIRANTQLGRLPTTPDDDLRPPPTRQNTDPDTDTNPLMPAYPPPPSSAPPADEPAAAPSRQGADAYLGSPPTALGDDSAPLPAREGLPGDSRLVPPSYPPSAAPGDDPALAPPGQGIRPDTHLDMPAYPPPPSSAPPADEPAAAPSRQGADADGYLDMPPYPPARQALHAETRLDFPTLPPPALDYVGSGPPTYDAEPTALPPADPDELDDLVADTVLDGARYGACTIRAVSVRGDSARFRGEPRRDSLLTARFGVGDQALILVAMATGARATPGAHRAAAEACHWIGRAVGRSHARLAEDIRAARRGDLKSGLQRLTDRSLGKLRASAAEQGIDPEEYSATLRCLLLPAHPECRTRVFFGVGAGGLFRLRGGEWQDIEPSVADAAGDPVVGFGSLPSETPEGDRLTMDLGIPTPPSPYDPAPEPPREPFRFRASVARPGDTLLMCTGGLAEPLRGEPELSAHLAGRWSDATPPGLATFLADTQVRVKGYADDRTAAAVWEA